MIKKCIVDTLKYSSVLTWACKWLFTERNDEFSSEIKLALPRFPINHEDTRNLYLQWQIYQTFGRDIGALKYLRYFWDILYFITETSAFLGCFHDLCKLNCDPQIRVLGDPLEQSDDMTIERCINYCLDLNTSTTPIQYAGLEAADECYCGKAGAHYDQHGQRPDSDCNKPCPGDSTQDCGSEFAIAIYDCKYLQGVPIKTLP